MYKQKIIIKYVYALVSILIIVSIGYVLFSRLNISDEVELDTETVFANNILEENNIENYAKNFYVHILNSMIPTVKTAYEKHYNAEMMGLIPSTVKTIADKANVDITNPLTYFRFVFTAFSQYSHAEETASLEIDPNNLPNITNFEDAPQGAIYFSEQDEYWAEETERQNNELKTDSQLNQDLLDSNIKNPDSIVVKQKDALVLLYHSHTSESYMPAISGNFHSIDEKYNVLSVGNIVAETLEKKYNYNVIHDKTYHDTESYAYSYNNSLATLKDQLSKRKSLKVLIDIHRDAFGTDLAESVKSKLKKDYTVKINGKNAAKVMLVIGGANENSKELEKFGVYIKKKMETLYPGLFFKLETKQGKYYNQSFSNYSMLIEVGCSFNTIEEANYTAQLVGNVIGEVIKDLEE